jgi:hypothetical protein
MNLLYPRFTWHTFRWLLVFGSVGACIAGAYGILHDQLTYALGPEYFTRFKFDQFHYLSRQQPLRIIVAEIGFLATWWVGFFAAWFMGRIALPHENVAAAARRTFKGVLMMLVAAIAFAIVGNLLAPTRPDDARVVEQAALLASYGVTDPVPFIRVGYIHNASYLGGLVGLIAALTWLRLTRPKSHPATLR